MKVVQLTALESEVCFRYPQLGDQIFRPGHPILPSPSLSCNLLPFCSFLSNHHLPISLLFSVLYSCMLSYLLCPSFSSKHRFLFFPQCSVKIHLGRICAGAKIDCSTSICSLFNHSEFDSISTCFDVQEWAGSEGYEDSLGSQDGNVWQLLRWGKSEWREDHTGQNWQNLCGTCIGAGLPSP